MVRDSTQARTHTHTCTSTVIFYFLACVCVCVHTRVHSHAYVTYVWRCAHTTAHVWSSKNNFCSYSSPPISWNQGFSCWGCCAVHSWVDSPGGSPALPPTYHIIREAHHFSYQACRRGFVSTSSELNHSTRRNSHTLSLHPYMVISMHTDNTQEQ